jgi:hypothetical protein
MDLHLSAGPRAGRPGRTGGTPSTPPRRGGRGDPAQPARRGRGRIRADPGPRTADPRPRGPGRSLLRMDLHLSAGPRAGRPGRTGGTPSTRRGGAGTGARGYPAHRGRPPRRGGRGDPAQPARRGRGRIRADPGPRTALSASPRPQSPRGTRTASPARRARAGPRRKRGGAPGGLPTGGLPTGGLPTGSLPGLSEGLRDLAQRFGRKARGEPGRRLLRAALAPGLAGSGAGLGFGDVLGGPAASARRSR